MPKVGIHLSSAQQILNEYSNVISVVEQGDTGFEIVKDQLEEKVKLVNNITLDAFKSLGYIKPTVKENEEDLNNNIRELQKDTSNLNGENLNKTFLQQFSEQDPFELDFQKDWQALRNYLISTLPETYTEDDLVTKFAHVVLNKAVTETFRFIKHERIKTQGAIISNTTGRFTGTMSEVYNEMGKKTRAAINDFMNDKTRNQGFEEWKRKNQIITNTLSEDWLFETVNIYSFLRMSAEQRKKLFDSNHFPNLKNRINAAFIQAIQDVCTCSSEDKDLLADCAKHILEQKDIAFFVGRSGTDLIGIIGELQALYFFRKIVKKNNTDTSVTWIGGLNNPHADLLLTSTLGEFGIQVKNTSYDRAENELYNIEFKDFSQGAKTANIQSTILSYDLTQPAQGELKKLGFTNPISEAIQNALAADVFNVPYIWENNRARQVQLGELDNKGLKANEFQVLRQKIDYYADKAEKIMALFSIALMYLQTTSTTNNGKSNTFYLISGTILTSAATILSTIVKEINNSLERMKHLNVRVKTGHHHIRTIVDFLNNDNSLAHKDIMRFTLQSSYNFG